MTTCVSGIWGYHPYFIDNRHSLGNMGSNVTVIPTFPKEFNLPWFRQPRSKG